MIQDTKFVKEVKSNSPKKGWKIEWHDGKFDNIFDESWLPILDQAQKEQRMVLFSKEKNQAGYWNIQTLELATMQVTPQPEPSNHLVEEAKKLGAVEDKMTPSMWDAKEARTRKSIERQKALELAITTIQKEDATVEYVIKYAKRYEQYLETGE